MSESKFISWKLRLFRAFLHSFVGYLNQWLFVVDPHQGWALMVMFGLYEINEDRHVRDGAFYDIIGWLIGFCFRALQVRYLGGWPL